MEIRDLGNLSGYTVIFGTSWGNFSGTVEGTLGDLIYSYLFYVGKNVTAKAVLK